MVRINIVLINNEKIIRFKEWRRVGAILCTTHEVISATHFVLGHSQAACSVQKGPVHETICRIDCLQK